jgi:hypothetical protein
MNFGYLIFVSSSEKCDYLKMAYALALSIKNTQKGGYNNIALVTDDPEQVEKLKSTWVFDHIIKWNQETFWNGRSWMDKLTPFDITVCLDADMIFLDDCSHWIDSLRKNFELFLPSKCYNYRNQVVTSDYYRKTFTKNSLPNLYSFFTFFKKDSIYVDEFFNLGRYIIKNPKEFSNYFLSNSIPLVLGTDEALSLSSKILGIDTYITADLDYPKIVHLKPELQNWPWSSKAVTDHVGFYVSLDGNLKIGNNQQDGIVHYVEKQLMTEEIISILERKLWKEL